jgi:hypothetical protein
VKKKRGWKFFLKKSIDKSKKHDTLKEKSSSFSSGFMNAISQKAVEKYHFELTRSDGFVSILQSAVSSQQSAVSSQQSA